MKKEAILFTFVVLFSLNLISAINLDVSVNPISNTVIADLNQPAIFDLSITNIEETDAFEIYSLIGMDLSPENSFIINSGETKKIRIEAMPQETIKSRKGYITFEYKIKNSLSEIQTEKLTLNIINLEEIISITPERINPKSEKIILKLENKVNSDFENIKITMTSAFFDYESDINFKALEIKQIEIPLNSEKIKILNAGDFLLNTKIKINDKIADIESIIKFLEQEDIESKEINEGIIIKRKEIIKNNLGNTKKIVKINAEKNLISYLFTSVNIEPTKTEIIGFTKYYTWEKELIPNEALKVIIKTNWFFPIIIILIIIGLIIVIKKSIETDISLRKHVSFVKTKGGEFALKISIKVRAKKFVERINIIDKLPPLVKLYERYGAISPDKIDLANRRLEWNIESLNQEEERIFTYIIYSRVGIVGKFELPETKAIYEKEGKVKETKSNRSFFINEPKK